MSAADLPAPSDPVPRLISTVLGMVLVTEEGPAGGPLVLCTHGTPGSRRDLRYLAPLLAERCRVVRVERPPGPMALQAGAGKKEPRVAGQ